MDEFVLEKQKRPMSDGHNMYALKILGKTIAVVWADRVGGRDGYLDLYMKDAKIYHFTCRAKLTESKE